MMAILAVAALMVGRLVTLEKVHVVLYRSEP